MNNFENLKKMSLEDFAAWLDENGQFDTAPWSQWFNDKYCKNCESIEIDHIAAKDELGIELFSWDLAAECAFCELTDESGKKKCRFFPDLEDIPDNKEVVKMWLEEEVNED